MSLYTHKQWEYLFTLQYSCIVFSEKIILPGIHLLLLSLPPCVCVCVSRSMSHVDVVILLFRWSACFCLFFFFSLSQSFMVLICVHHVATPGKYVSIQRIRCGVALCVCVVHSLCLTWSEKKTKPAV